MAEGQRSRASGVVTGLRWLISAVLTAFFGFVGWMKTFAPLGELRQHHAWTVALPEPVGRAVGLSEMLGAALLTLSLALPSLRRWHRRAAIYFIANQLVAAAVHLGLGEHGALPQNAVLTAGFIFLAATARPTSFHNDKMERIA